MSSEKYQIIFATGNQGKIREIKAIVEENKSRPVPGSQAEAGEAVPEIEVLSMKEAGIDYDAILENSDTYHALDRIDALIRTGATGTNVNDLILVLTGNENE